MKTRPYLVSLKLRSFWLWTCFNQSGLSLLPYVLEILSTCIFWTRNSNLKSVSNIKQLEISRNFNWIRDNRILSVIIFYCSDIAFGIFKITANFLKINHDNAAYFCACWLNEIWLSNFHLTKSEIEPVRLFKNQDLPAIKTYLSY